MQRRRLGRSEIEVGAIGLGCWAIGGPFQRTDGSTVSPMGWGGVDDQESIRAIHRALDLGVTLFDTANNYGAGHSERILGQALAGRRDDVVIVTKFGSVFDEEKRLHYDNRELELTADAIGEACEASLRRLDTDRIDVYLYHWGGQDPEIAKDAIPVLEGLVAAGKIRYYGWSTDDPQRAALFAQGEHCTAVEMRLNIFADNPELLAVCEEHDIAALIRQPLNSGTLTGKFRPTTTFPSDDGRHGIDFTEGLGAQRLEQVEALQELLVDDRRSLTQAALAWVLTRHEATIPIPGFKTTAQVEELATASDTGLLDASQMAAVEQLFGRAPL